MEDKSYQIDLISTDDVLHLSIAGRTTKQNAGEIAESVIKLFGEYRPARALIDCRKLIGRFNVADTYYHVKSYPLQRHNPAKTAIIDNPENEPYYSFHETTASNAGAFLKYFTGIDEAMKWLSV